MGFAIFSIAIGKLVDEMSFVSTLSPGFAQV